ncbi:MAG TPA: holo-ACP synthase [Acidimicrobiales bacterium]|nr:holo-ACP synthase [Acidimicrobiales bacterium]
MVAGRIVGLGIDLVDIDRFRAVLERRPAMRARLFTPDELAYADTHKNPAPSLAARFAVKEAVMKALSVGIGAIDWTDVSIRRESSGAPAVELRGRAAELAGQMGITDWQVSITHTDTAAMATVIAST